MRLYLVRHGRAAAGIEELDPGLDPLGVAQAERAARALVGTGATRLVSSPLRRARETAAPIARALALPVEIRDEVSEVFDASLDTDTRRAMLGPLLSGRWGDQSDALRGWRERVLATLVELGAAPTIVVSHFIAISAAVGAATHDDRISYSIGNASITTLDVERGELVLCREGDARHLE